MCVGPVWLRRQLIPGQQPPAAIVLRSLRKVFPARDGNAEKVSLMCWYHVQRGLLSWAPVFL